MKFVDKILKWILLTLVMIYQRTFSPLMPDICRFQPTCSNYFAEAVRKKGAIRGAWMGTIRVLKCNPFGPYGYDPVDKD
jgi:putative membrane protein insertion efficiency factor